MARIRIYRSYRFIDKDNIIDAVRTVVQAERLNNYMVQQITGVAAGTLEGWFDGPTRKPQNATVTAVTSALGYVRRDSLNKDGTINVGYVKERSYKWRDEIEKQADWILKHGGKAKKKKSKANGG